MQQYSLDVLHRTVDKTRHWLEAVGEQLDTDAQHAYHALRAVLFTLRDRLTTDEAFDLSAQLPLLVRGIFWDGYHPAGKPERIDTEEQFLARVAHYLEPMAPMEAERCVGAVFRVLDDCISAGEMEDVERMLPHGVRNLLVRQRAGGERAQPSAERPTPGM